MPYISAWFHFVWSTKNRQPFLVKEIRSRVFEHIRQNARQKGIFLAAVNGYTDHVHCLVSLSSDQTISRVLQLIKGESAYWINKEKLCDTKFEWQDEYFAISVSHSGVGIVKEYILNQERHHQLKSFGEEYREFLQQYQFAEQGPGNEKTY